MPTVPPQNAIGSSVPQLNLDSLTRVQQEQLGRARQIYLEAGGELDIYWQPQLVRHLIAHNWSLHSTEKPSKCKAQLVATARWRKSVGANDVRRRLREGEWRFVDMLHVQPTLGVIWFLPCSALSHTGDLVSYLFLGTLDVATWLRIIDNAQYYDYNMCVLECQAYFNDKLSFESRRLVRHVNLLDGEGMGLRHISPRALRRLMPCFPVGDLYYPEMLSAAVLTNAPWVLYKAWSIVRHLLSPELQARTIIVSKAETAATLARLTTVEQVPTAIAGGGGASASLSPDTAAVLGYAQMDAASFGELLITKPTCEGGCAETYSISNDASARVTSERGMLLTEATSATEVATRAPAEGAAGPDRVIWVACNLVGTPMGAVGCPAKHQVLEHDERPGRPASQSPAPTRGHPVVVVVTMIEVDHG